VNADSALGIAAAVRSGTRRAVEVVEEHLTAIAARDGEIHAFNLVTAEEARQAALALDRRIAAGEDPGPLAGVPVALKDNLATTGVATTCSSRILEGWRPPYDATVVRRLAGAGAVVVGKTNLDEFAMGSSTENSAFGPTRNPHDTSRVPGGSSGGSAAAVAAGFAPLALGSDTGGSIRQPAALCGVVGMKPTYGRVSRRGIIAISWSLDHVGPMSRTVADNAVLLNVLAGHDALDETSSTTAVPDYTRALTRGVRGMRMGIPRSALLDGYHPDVMRAYDEALKLFRSLGAAVVDVEMPPTFAAADEVQTIVRIAEAASYHEPFLASKAEKYGKTDVRRDVEAGSLITATQYLRAQKVRAQFTRDFGALFRTFDVFVTPGMPAPAGERNEARQPFRRVFNVCGFPALVLPAGVSTTPPGLPLSLQIAAKPFDEETIYAAAAAFERATRWHLRRPMLEEPATGA
jgi:aspartyl-tRNA(Asn)/glutamyl-tRNA(Gln) amidotransferase subunit A